MSIKTDNSWGAVAGFTLVAALVGGFYLRQGPLETRRPDQGAVLAEVAADEFVLSRLWQDPLHAIQTDWNRIASMGTETDLPLDVRTIRSKLREESGKQLRLLVMMSGAPYAEDRENRRRQRHAVVSALTENDYVPKDHERLGYFTAPCFEEQCRRRSSVRSQNAGRAQQKMLIGFESYEPALELELEALQEGNGNAEVAWDSVLVLWLNDDDFGPCALNQASALASYLDGESEPATTVLVGPRTSGALRRLRPIGSEEECDRAVTEWWSKTNERSKDEESGESVAPTIDLRLQVRVGRRSLRGASDSNANESQNPSSNGNTSPPEVKAAWSEARLHVLSPRATAPLDRLFPRENGTAGACLKAGSVGQASRADNCLAEYLDVASFDSVVARDDIVLSTILQELRARGASRLLIAIVSEQDSEYGRLLDDVVGDVLCRDREYGRDGPNERFEVREYGYLAGVDGEMPTTAVASDARRETGVGRTADESADSAFIARGHGEAAFGEAQLDYVRRLADSIAHDLKRTDLRANGALRCEETFGASGASGANGSNTELWVNSRKRLPMRAVVGILGADVYDKLAILEALRDQLPSATFFTTDLDARLSHPDVYPFTRNLIVGSAYGLTVKDLRGAPFRDSYQTATYRAVALALDIRNGLLPKHARVPHPRLFEIGRTGAVDITDRHAGTVQADYEQIHGEVPYIRSRSSRARRIAEGLGILTPLLALIALVLVSRITLQEKTASLRRKARFRVASVGIFVVIFLVFLMWLLSEGFEPWPLLEGVNSLPTLVMYVTILAYAYSIVDVMNARMTQTERAIAADYHLSDRDKAEGWKIAKMCGRESNGRYPPWIWEWRRNVPRDTSPTEGLCAEACWNEYLKYSGRHACAVRVAISATCGLVAVVLVERVFLQDPPLLTRGFVDELKLSEYVATGFALFALFYCSDLLKLSHAMLRHIAWHEVLVWPQLPRTELTLQHWRSMRFLERYTDSVMPIVATPFVLLSLHIVARSTLFEGWASPVRIHLVYAGLVVYVVVWALRFQREAVKAKKAILASLDRCRQEVVGHKELADRLRVVKERIEGIQKGAFVPWIRHPIVSSLLLPAVAYGVTLVLEAMR